jgi:transcriptional regulator with XRE-family HTH domain
MNLRGMAPMNFNLKLAILKRYPVQADFAKHIGISETVLSRLIKERREATPELKEAIATELGVHPSEIFPQT